MGTAPTTRTVAGLVLPTLADAMESSLRRRSSGVSRDDRTEFGLPCRDDETPLHVYFALIFLIL